MVNPPGNKALSRLAAVALIVALLFVVALNAASAQEPETVAAPRPQPTDTMVTVLRPGDNLVGWIEPEASVANLFNAVAEVETVWAWDALQRQWLVASRDVPVELHTLRTLKPGMGLLVQVGGNESVEWTRSAYPVRGLVQLQAGYNLVAWSGSDGSAIDHLALGIGWSLRTVRRWDAATQQWQSWTSPERSTQLIVDRGSEADAVDGETEAPVIRRGEALWVEVSRTVNWLQPTGVLPSVDYPSEATQQQRDAFNVLVGDVLDFFAARYGIEADHSTLTVYLGDSGWARFDELSVYGSTCLDTSDGGTMSDRHKTLCLYTLSHEYFHVLQVQFSPWATNTPLWMLEGNAERAKFVLQHPSFEEEGHWGVLRRFPDGSVRSTLCFLGPLPSGPFSLEGKLLRSPYGLGAFATLALAARAGNASVVEYWRRLAPSPAGPQGRWQSQLPWYDVFQDVFAISVREFYVELHQLWQSHLADHTSCGYGEPTGRLIQGKLTGDDGAPIRGVLVRAHKPDDAYPRIFNGASTDANGEFRIRPIPSWNAGLQEIVLEIRQDDTCLLFYGDNGFAATQEDALSIPLEDQVTDVSIRMSSELCPRVSGHIVDQDGHGLNGVLVALVGVSGASVRASRDGAFSLRASALRKHAMLFVGLTFRGCGVYAARDEGATGTGTELLIIDLTNGDVGGLVVRVPDDSCP